MMMNRLSLTSRVRATACVVLLLACIFCCPFPGDASELYDPRQLMSTPVVSYDKAMAKRLSARFEIASQKMSRSGGADIRYLLTCAGAEADGTVKGLNLIVSDWSSGVPKVSQRIKLGSGSSPEMIFSHPDPSEADAVMIRSIKQGNVSEFTVLTIDRESKRLSGTFAFNRAVFSRSRLDIKAQMQRHGVIDVRAKRPRAELSVDLYHAIEALVEDGLYGPDHRPVPSLVNLKCVRIGWEGEALKNIDGKTVLEIGASMVAASDKPVLTVGILFTRDDAGRWQPISLDCAPFMPYDI